MKRQKTREISKKILRLKRLWESFLAKIGAIAANAAKNMAKRKELSRKAASIKQRRSEFSLSKFERMLAIEKIRSATAIARRSLTFFLWHFQKKKLFEIFQWKCLSIFCLTFFGLTYFFFWKVIVSHPEMGCIVVEIVVFIDGVIQFNQSLGLYDEKNQKDFGWHFSALREKKNFPWIFFWGTKNGNWKIFAWIFFSGTKNIDSKIFLWTKKCWPEKNSLLGHISSNKRVNGKIGIGEFSKTRDHHIEGAEGW